MITGKIQLIWNYCPPWVKFHMGAPGSILGKILRKQWGILFTFGSYPPRLWLVQHSIVFCSNLTSHHTFRHGACHSIGGYPRATIHSPGMGDISSPCGVNHYAPWREAQAEGLSAWGSKSSKDALILGEVEAFPTQHRYDINFRYFVTND